jgi:NAD(P)-dependent dehydrogenase (short-subunit alcohol dehydrogenase family)
MDLQLEGKRAIITGGSGGIGFAVAQVLVTEGADVVLVARNPNKLDSAQQRLADMGRNVLAIVADTTDDSAVQAMVDRTATEMGGMDILVNAAADPGGSTPARALADFADDDLRIEIETKVLGYLRCARAVAPYMVSQGWGRIINVSGLAARQTGNIVGSVRNVAVAAMSKNLADELGPAGINVTVVHPGMTITDRTSGLIAEIAQARGISHSDATAAMVAGVSIGRAITAAEVADVVAFLASPRSVAINGDPIAVGGGSRGAIYY